ncbi:MAG: cupin domain-containing protein [Promethearchaeota archaeon]
MIKKNFNDVKEKVVTKANAEKTTIRWLITKDDGAEKMATRRFKIEPDGKIDLHDHPEEHHIYILHGEGTFLRENKTSIIGKAGDVIFIPSNEKHGMMNSGSVPLVFLCVIPYI